MKLRKPESRTCHVLRKRLAISRYQHVYLEPKWLRCPTTYAVVSHITIDSAHFEWHKLWLVLCAALTAEGPCRNLCYSEVQYVRACTIAILAQGKPSG